MFIIYDLVFLFIAIFYLPFYLIQGKFHKGFLARLGFLPKNLDLDSPIWIHAVSVGEVMSIKGLLEELRVAYPNKKIVLSTVTATGNKVAREMLKESKAYVTYLPLDISFIVRKVIKKIKPSLFIIAETEIWPNLITCLSANHIPVIVVNGRISDRSFRGYSFLKIFIKPILRRINRFCVQTNEDARRLAVLGVEEDRIRVAGNLKFDIKLDGDYNFEEERVKLGLGNQHQLLVAGSTHPGEEQFILDAYKELLYEFKDLKLLIAPRHPERSAAIKSLVSHAGFSTVFISQVKDACPACLPRAVFILDTMGKLNNFYAIADIVFVGGSLVKKGGHNILEPAAKGKPIIFGSYMFNFRDIASLFLDNQAAISVSDPLELRETIRFLLENQGERRRMSQEARTLLINNQGVVDKTIQEISSVYKSK